jgi:hypothetical protein
VLVIKGQKETYPAVVDVNISPLVLFTFTDVNPGDIVGTAVSDGPQVNGCASVLIGAPGAAGGKGEVYSVPGAASYSPRSFDARVLGSMGGSVLTGPSIGSGFGGAVGNLGNLDGNFWIGIGAYLASPNNLRNAGQFFMVAVPLPAVMDFGIPSPAIITILGIYAGGFLGNDFAGVGDFIRNGSPDIAIGSCGASPGALVGAGELYVADLATLRKSSLVTLRANGGAVMSGSSANAFFTNSVSPAGDVNGDQKPDIAVGMPGASPNGLNSGAVVILFGGSNPPATVAGIGTYRFCGEWTGSRRATWYICDQLRSE